MVFSVHLNVCAKDFVFTAIPDQDETKLQQRFGKVADYLSKTLGVKVKYVPVKSYAAAVTAFRNMLIGTTAVLNICIDTLSRRIRSYLRLKTAVQCA